MKKNLTLAETKQFFKTENCFETATAYGVNLFGKYQPNMTFIVPKAFEIGINNEPVSPLTYIEDAEVTGNMNIDFDGAASFIFGDFWTSRKGGACFRPKNPLQAAHLLIKVEWGGCFNKHRGTWPEQAKGVDGILYFRRASSNGGGAGCDYWVVPVGFARFIYDEEIDGDVTIEDTAFFSQRAQAYQQKYAALQKQAVDEVDASVAHKAEFLPRLMEIRLELERLQTPQRYGRYVVNLIEVGEVSFGLGYPHWHSYNEEGLAAAEKYLTHVKEWIRQEEERKRAECANT